MHTAEWLKQEDLSYSQGARELGLPNAMSLRRYALNLELPRPHRMRDMFARSGGKIDRWGRGATVVTLADISDGEAEPGQVNGSSAAS